MQKPYKYVPFVLILIGILYFSNCGNSKESDQPDLPGTEYTVTISWDENHETLVNRLGGGYIVYCCKDSNFTVDDSGVVICEVPCQNGSSSPTSTKVTLESGTWYIKVVAYIELDGMTVSSPSIEKSIYLP
jgi:hypothetical protein